MKNIVTALRCVTLVMCAAVLVFSADPAMAAKAKKAAPSSVYSWSGFYAGVHIGGTFGVFDNDFAIIGPSGRAGGVNGGGQIGYNWQFGSDVFGVEADFSAIDMSAETAPNKFSEDWQSTIRGRYGRVLYDTLLPFTYMPYLTAGVALTGISTETAAGKGGGTAVGYALGAGIEAPICDRLTARFEYLRTDAPKDNYPAGGTPVHGGSANNTVRVGVNYNFGTY